MGKVSVKYAVRRDRRIEPQEVIVLSPESTEKVSMIV